MTHRIPDRITRFLRDETATVALEAIIIAPVLAWLFVGSFVFFDAFRVYSTSIKATYAVADVLSRQTETIYSSDIEGLADLFQHLTRNANGSAMRVTQVRQTGNGYRVDWSHATDGRARLFNVNLASGTEAADSLPIMVPGERIIVVETFLPYRPAFNVGLGNLEFTNFTATRPRFAGQVSFTRGTEPSWCGSGCNTGGT